MGGKWLRNNVNCCTDKYCVTTSHRIYPQGMNCLVRKVRPFWHRKKCEEYKRTCNQEMGCEVPTTKVAGGREGRHWYEPLGKDCPYVRLLFR